MYRSFGVEPPATRGVRRAVLWAGALAFVAISVFMLVVINFFSLFFGVTMNFLGRNGVRFRFLHLFRRVPVIGVTLPVLFVYAIWHNAMTTGAWAIAWPSILTLVFAVALLGAIILVNTLASPRDR